MNEGVTDKRLAGQIAIITGCDSPIGIGIASAWKYAGSSCKAIYICDVINDHLEKHASELSTMFPDTAIHARQFDAANETSVKQIVDESIQTYGRLDIFFANAGISGKGKILFELDALDWMKVMEVNTLSVFLAIKYAAPAMRMKSREKIETRGSIIATASVAGLRSGAGSTPYSASKAAVINTIQTAAYQLSGTNIRCNAICPGLIATGMTKPTFEGAAKRGTSHKIGQINPAQRGGEAKEIAAVSLFLASDASSYVNGQAWAVDGGLSASLPYVRGKLA